MPSVLIADDEPLISMMVKDWLAELGYDTIGPADSVANALRLLAGPRPDGAILDIALGNQECYPVADALRERGVPFAFATGYGTVLEPRFKEVPILSKPFDFETVRTVIGELIGGNIRKSNS